MRVWIFDFFLSEFCVCFFFFILSICALFYNEGGSLFFWKPLFLMTFFLQQMNGFLSLPISASYVDLSWVFNASRVPPKCHGCHPRACSIVNISPESSILFQNIKRGFGWASGFSDSRVHSHHTRHWELVFRVADPPETCPWHWHTSRFLLHSAVDNLALPGVKKKKKQWLNIFDNYFLPMWW